MCGPPNIFIALLVLLAGVANVYLLWLWLKRFVREMKLVYKQGWGAANFTFLLISFAFLLIGLLIALSEC